MNENWSTVRFDDVARQVKDKVDPKNSDLERYIAGGHMDTDELRLRRWGIIDENYLGPSFHRRFKKGHILYGSRRTYLRKVAVAHFEGVCSNTTFVIEAVPEQIHPPLLPFIMQSEPFVEHSIKNSRGSTNPYVTWKDIAKYEFALPPLSEQRRIAEILSAVEETRGKYFRLIKSLLKLKRSIFLKHIFEGAWEKIFLGEIADISSGSTPNRRNESYWRNGTIPWLTTSKVNDEIIYEAEEFVTEKAVQKLSLKFYDPGTILIALYGQGQTRGSTALLKCQATINQAFAAVEVDDRQVDRAYLYHYLHNSYHKLRSYSQGSNQQNLSGYILKKFPIKLPPMKIQKKFGAKLNKCDVQVEVCRKHLKKIDLLKKTITFHFLG